MPRKTNPVDDCWHGIEDSKKRKQIQDRLAQRARRKRLREAEDNAKRARSQPETPQVDDVATSSSPESQLVPFSAKPTSHVFLSCTDYVPTVISDSEPEVEGANLVGTVPIEGSELMLWAFPVPFELPLPSPLSQPKFPLTIFGALYLNGNLLGIDCGHIIGKTPPTCDMVPVPLRPTKLQLITVHQRWLDRIPFPKFRDNFITLEGIVDENQFLHDVFTMPSFQIKPGTATWDPRGWYMEKEFAQKWGYLFY